MNKAIKFAVVALVASSGANVIETDADVEQRLSEIV